MELEEAIKELKHVRDFGSDTGFAYSKKNTERLQNAIETVLQALENSIPKEVVEKKIEEYNKKIEEDKGNPNWIIQDNIVINVLQELLEGE